MLDFQRLITNPSINLNPSPTIMKKYYFFHGTEHQGPFDLDELKTKNISRHTSIWFEGIPNWTEAEKIDELKPLFSSMTSPYSSSTKSSPLFTSYRSSNAFSTAWAPPFKKSRRKLIVEIIIGALVLLGAIFIANNS
jgi:hypothetical protein